MDCLGRGNSQLQVRNQHREKDKQNKPTQTSMPWVGFEVITPDYEPVKIVHASEGVVAVIDWDGTTAG
jgi:hypothetical protein